MVTSQGHWHVDPETKRASRAPGAVGDCCKGFLSYIETVRLTAKGEIHAADR